MVRLHKIQLTAKAPAPVNNLMRIENEKPVLRAHGQDQFSHFTPEQKGIVDLFYRSYSIAEVAQYFFIRGQLVSFRSILETIEFLLEEKLIVNARFYEYFTKYKSTESGFFEKLADQLFNSKKPEISSIERISNVPFFRSLNPEILNVFLQDSSILTVPAGIVLCKEGSLERSLMILLEGEATVYKKDKNGIQKRCVVLNESSLFGETGFFFNEPRAASVITDQPSRILVIKYIPEKYDTKFKTEKARELQQRIWIIHALLKSEMFRALPQECFDALIFSGELKTFPPQTLICRQGDTGRTCYLIVQGSVNVSKDRVFIRSLGQGDSFGEVALTMTRGERTASVQSVSEVMALEIEMDRFYKMLSENLILGCEFEKLALQRR